MSKEIKVTIDQQFDGDNNKSSHEEIIVKAPTVKELQFNESLYVALYFWGMSEYKIEESFKLTNCNSLNFLKFILSKAYLKEFWELNKKMKEALKFFFGDFLYIDKDNELIIQNVKITDEIWNYLIYVLKLIQGEKISKPVNMNNLSPAEKKWMEAQKKMQDKIDSIKKQSNNNKDADSDILIKIILSIIYAFPALKIDYLFNQTMAQIHWLQKYAAGSVSYNLNSMVMAAGNMKKGSKLEFFIK